MSNCVKILLINGLIFPRRVLNQGFY